MRITGIHSLWNIIQDFCHSRDDTASAATYAAAGSKSNNALSDASSRLNSGSRKKKKKSDRMSVLKPAAHSQPELDLLNDFDWDDADKVQDVLLKSLSQKVQLDVMAKNLAWFFSFDWTCFLSFVSLLFSLRFWQQRRAMAVGEGAAQWLRSWRQRRATAVGRGVNENNQGILAPD